jgi:hypothetical protein
MEKPTQEKKDGTPNEKEPSDQAIRLTHIEWTEENEMIMVEWCDVAQCYKWLNARAHARYAYMHAWFTIPAIVLSTISGTASFAQTSLPVAYQSYAPMAIGTLNIFIGILTTVQQYLKISELNEAHRVSAISWDKFARNIRIELAKKPEERMKCENFLKINRQEFDRLMETSPMVSESIIQKFNAKFKDKPGFDKVKKPDICDVIVSAENTRYKYPIHEDVDFTSLNIESDIIKTKDEILFVQHQKLLEKENELKNKHLEESQRLRRELVELTQTKKIAKMVEKEQKDNIKRIDEYINHFKAIYERNPLSEEIFDNMKDTIDLTILKEYLEKYDNFI